MGVSAYLFAFYLLQEQVEKTLVAAAIAPNGFCDAYALNMCAGRMPLSCMLFSSCCDAEVHAIFLMISNKPTACGLQIP